MKLIIISLFLFNVMVFGQDQETTNSQNLESPQAEACTALSVYWMLAKYSGYADWVCPKQYKNPTRKQIEECAWKEMKTHFSTPESMDKFLYGDVEFVVNNGEEKGIGIIANTISPAAETLIGENFFFTELTEQYSERCGSIPYENTKPEEVKKMLICYLQIVDDKKAEIDCS